MTDYYYYAGGSRVELQADKEHIAFVRDAAPAALVERVLGSSRVAPSTVGGLVITPKSAIDARDVAALERAGALCPVFRRDRVMLVPLPEVRVEVDDVGQRAAVKAYLSTIDIVVSEETDDRFILKPSSGKPLDALNTANAIFEQAHPAASSVRFVQFVERPDPRR